MFGDVIEDIFEIRVYCPKDCKIHFDRPGHREEIRRINKMKKNIGEIVRIAFVVLVILSVLITFILLLTHENASWNKDKKCKADCESINHTFFHFDSGGFAGSMCTCKTGEGEVVSIWG